VRNQDLLGLVELDALHDRLLDPNTPRHKVALCTPFPAHSVPVP
jgi:hypothetical protein